MKKLISSFLCLSIISTISSPALAIKNLYTDTTNIMGKVAIVTNVLDDGSNLNNDQNISDNTTIHDISLNITHKSNDELQISTSILNNDISVSCVPAAKSANNQAIFYDTSINNTNFAVVNMEYVNDAKTSMFFKSYADRNNISKILKLYLKDISSNTRDYIMIECFDFEIPNFNNLIDKLPQNTMMGAWVAKEFVPIDVGYFDTSTNASTSNTQRTYTVSYNDFGLPQTHTITLATDCTYSDIRVGQSADIIYRLEIIGKTAYSPNAPALSSDTESSLHVEAASLRQTTVPNVAFISSAIDGKVQKQGIISPSLSARIGVSYGILSASLSMPVSFSGVQTIDINDIYNGYVNGRDGKYTRSIKTTMDKYYKLTQIGYYFEVRSTIADFGNVAKNTNYHKGTWDVSIINLWDKSIMNKTISQNVPIAIQK